MRHDARLTKLEALRLRLVTTTQPLSVCVFGLDNSDIGGYAHGDTLIFRNADETIEDLKSRCIGSVAHTGVTTLNFFEPF